MSLISILGFHDDLPAKKQKRCHRFRQIGVLIGDHPDMKRKRPLVKKLLRKSSRPTGWSEDLWNDIFASSMFKLIVDRYRFLSKTSDATRVLGEPGDVSFASKSHGFRSISLITRQYFGRLGHVVLEYRPPNDRYPRMVALGCCDRAK